MLSFIFSIFVSLIIINKVYVTEFIFTFGFLYIMIVMFYTPL
ncbi:hypothetical protein CLU96_3182 [Chryseobacterium sp. 52]|nr:hypothetical protein CLU96_3182 [Chryseobacterium sp. 52]